MNEPLISVIIPSYNRATDLKRAIRSVINQSYKNWELIVVDNSSSDNTDDVVTSFQNPRITLLKIKNHGVIAASRNLGFKNAKGEFIALLDSDDWWKPKKLEFAVDALNKGADIVYHDLYLVKDQKQKFYRRETKTRKLRSPVYTDLLMNGNGILNSSVVFRSSLIHEIGYLNEDREFIAWEDFDYWLRLAKRNSKFVKIKPILGYYWSGGGNESNDDRTLNILNSFLGNYSKDLIKNPWWIHYIRGKIYYNRQNYRRAIEEFLDVKDCDFKFKLKSFMLILASKFQFKE
ncbi:glycosyltransferase family 2 protein [Leptospira santarosai]|uniref:glycosyltransferase family 2 protein n=1 Tax=Leptospira santarosai TaxID=28183 RepID=UPI000297805D|nr:glycosyltransferase [Leptospira santarosai]EKS08087.1 glycosyltransferase-like protein, family 2 [Leptospira santarosai str. JET]